MKKILYLFLILIIACEVFGEKHPVIRLAPNEEFTPGYLQSETKEKLPPEEDYIMAVKTTGKNFTEVIYSYNGIRYPLFDKTEPLGDKLVSTFINNKYGLITEHGKIIVSAKSPYKILKIYNENYLVTENNKYGLIDKNYNLIIPIKYNSFYYINDNYIIVNYTFDSNTYSNIIDISGKKHFGDTEFQEIIPLNTNNNFIGIKSNLKSIFSFDGKQIGENYTNIEQYNNVYICEKGDTWKIIDLEGKIIFDGKDLGKIYNKTEFGVETINNKLHGFTDYEGNTIFKNEYKEIIFFYNKIIGIKDKFSVIYNPKTKQSQTINHEFDLLNSEDRKIIIKQ